MITSIAESRDISFIIIKYIFNKKLTLKEKYILLSQKTLCNMTLCYESLITMINAQFISVIKSALINTL